MKFNDIAEKAKPGQSTVESSLHGLATIVALMVALVCSGQIWEITFPVMNEYLSESYGRDDMATFGAFVFSCLSIATVLFICRIVLVLGMMLLAQNVLFRFAF